MWQNTSRRSNLLRCWIGHLTNRNSSIYLGIKDIISLSYQLIRHTSSAFFSANQTLLASITTMIVKSSKVLATAALVMGLLPSAFACLEISGSTNVYFGGPGSITTTDNGVQTCRGEVGTGDHNVGMF